LLSFVSNISQEAGTIKLGEAVLYEADGGELSVGLLSVWPKNNRRQV
jgi:predicted acyltransferase